MKSSGLLLCLVLLLPAALPAQNRPQQQRRQELQREIGDRFMRQVAKQLRLDEATQSKLEQHLRQTGEQRRDLAERSQILRIQMVRAARDSATADAELRRLLSEATALRQKEEDLWQADQASLARILTPRQHVQFVFLWLRFTDQIRDMASRQGRR
ncbi:MAG: hypothetical protein ACT443_15260 [Gemmatimonadota bacterium]